MKLYLPSALREFLYEKEANQMLVNHPGIVSAVESVSSSETTSPLIINGRTFMDYSYILLPFHGNGNLLEFL